MAQKRGKGGYGSENFDPETGRYIKDDNTYHAGVGASVNELLSLLKEGYFDQPEEGFIGSQFFANDKDDELEEDEELWQTKSDLVAYLQDAIDKENTRQSLLNTNFPEITENEFQKYGQECKNVTSVRDQGGFYNGYRGDPTSFEFNKALRFGLQQFYSIYPQFENSPYLNPQAITERAKKLDNLTNSWEFPEDKKVIRFVDTAPLVSWFKSSGIFDGMDLYTNEFNLEMLREGYDKQELVNRINNFLIGTKVPPDGSFTSFSCLSDASHMAKNLDNNKRSVLIRYNVRKGTKAWISDYGYESEGLFNRRTGFFIQGASLERIGNKEVVVLEYGIQ